MEKIIIQLEKLPFAFNSFEPGLSKESFEYHYLKHHKSYVDNLNILLNEAGAEILQNKTLIEVITIAKQFAGNSSFIPDNFYKKIYNNAAQDYNHRFFWNSISPVLQKIPSKIANLIEKSFDSVENFNKLFHQKGTQLFGSGWIWLVYDKMKNKLEIIQSSNADACLPNEEKIPLLVCDVWEHAYYVDYRNRRMDYLKFILKCLNWENAGKLINGVDKRINLLHPIS